MPIVEITLAEGRSAVQLRGLLAEVHEAVGRALADPSLPIRVILREVPPEHWLAEGVTLAERAKAQSQDEPRNADETND